MSIRYIAKTGISWPGNDGKMRRAEIGEEVPAAVVSQSRWLLEQGLVDVLSRDGQAEPGQPAGGDD